MRSGIEMQRIHDVVIIQRILGRNIDILRPVRRADDDHGVRVIVPDDRNDHIGVFLYRSPVGMVRLVADLIDDIVIVPVFL